jgi:hypothetical protein
LGAEVLERRAGRRRIIIDHSIGGSFFSSAETEGEKNRGWEAVGASAVPDAQVGPYRRLRFWPKEPAHDHEPTNLSSPGPQLCLCGCIFLFAS